MNIIKAHSSTEDCDPNIEALLPDLCSDQDTVTYEYIPEDSTQDNTPDYYLQEPQELVEVKAIMDNAEVSRGAQWGRIIGNLQKHRDAHPNIGLVKGVYIIETPATFRFPQDAKSLDFAIEKLIEAITTGLAEITIFKVRFKVNKVQGEGSSIHFSTTWGGSFSSADIIHTNIETQVEKANRQLGYRLPGKTVNHRTLLLVNEYGFGASRYHNDVVTALSYMLRDLATYTNIDAIWVQHKEDGGSYSNRLVATKQFIADWDAGTFTVNETGLQLLQQWFYALISLSDEQKERAFNALKTALSENQPAHSVFDDTGAREQMVGLGKWLFEQKRYDDLQWLVERFVDDPSVTIVAYDGRVVDYADDVRAGKHNNSISTVVGNMCWQIMYLAVAPNKTVVALDLVGHVLSSPVGENLYVIQMLTFPLLELAKRAQLVKKYDDEHGTKHFEQLDGIVRRLLNGYAQYPAIADGLAHVYLSYPFMDNELADKALERLREAEQADVLFIQYALYTPGLDREHFKETLKATIQDTDPADSQLRDMIAWELLRALNNKVDTFENLKPWFELFLDKPYDQEWSHAIELVMKYMAEHNMGEVTQWFEKYVKGIRAYLETHQVQSRVLWLDINAPLTYMAQHAPEKLLETVGALYEAWLASAFIGDPLFVFGIYKEVEDPQLKEQIKEQLHKWHDEMRKINPAINELTWD